MASKCKLLQWIEYFESGERVLEIYRGFTGGGGKEGGKAQGKRNGICAEGHVRRWLVGGSFLGGIRERRNSIWS